MYYILFIFFIYLLIFFIFFYSFIYLFIHLFIYLSIYFFDILIVCTINNTISPFPFLVIVELL